MFTFLQLFAANQNKPPDIVSILVANRSKLLRLFADFKTDKGKRHFIINNMWGAMFTILVCFIAEDEQFEADKAQVVREIAALEPRDGWCPMSELCCMFSPVVFIT
jgi:calcium binding protein 39